MKKVSDHILRRVYVLFGLFVLFGVAIVLRILAIQVNKSNWVQKKVDEQVFFKKLVADRGNILSDDGTIMATSLPFFKVAMDPSVLDSTTWDNFDDSLRLMSWHFAQQFPDWFAATDSINDSTQIEYLDTLRVYTRVRKAISEKDRHVYLLREKINFKELEVVKTWPVLRQGRFKGGLVVERFNNERFYPLENLARITLGSMVNDTVPLRGIEYAYHQDLRGRDGYMLAQKVVGGSFVPLDQFGENAASDGLDIVTTLNVDMQDVVEEALRRGVERNYANYGVAILMEVGTGKIKAIANYPETYNHAVATSIEPGSTFKTASAAALLEDGHIKLTDTIATGDGTIMYDDKEVTDNGSAWGNISFEQVFAHSSNVGVSKTVNEKYGEDPEAYLAHLKRFGFYAPVNRQLVGEPTPKIIRPEDQEWTIATLPSLSYGYSVQVTPLQMAAFYNGIANGGQLLRPWFVSEIRENARVIQQFSPELIEPHMMSKETVNEVHQLMAAVVSYGTASRAMRNLPFKVVGKTGTARKTEVGRGYVRKYRASFGGYFPADSPRYSLFIMVDEPKGKAAGGGSVAAPIFRDIALQVYRMDLQMTKPPAREEGRPIAKPAPKAVYAEAAEVIYPTIGISTSQAPQGEWVQTTSNGHQVNLTSFDMEADRIPDVRGMSGRDALMLLEQMGLQVTIKGNGRVRRQSLLPGYKIGGGEAITLFLS